MAISVRESADGSRFELYEDGRLEGFVDCVPEGDAIAVTHTTVHPSRGGRGLATELIHSTLETLRDRGQMVLPYCPFVVHYISEHPEFVSLVPANTRSRFGLAG